VGAEGGKMEKYLWILVALALATTVAVGTLVRGPAPVTIERSERPRITSPEVTEAELGELVSGNTSFALDLYGSLRQGEGNLLFSPYSISQCLAMVYAGARGETAQEIASALGFKLPEERLHPAFDALDLSLLERANVSGNELLVANGIWAQRGFPVKREYLDLLAAYYGAGLMRVDFRRDPEGARMRINRWVEEKTKGRIEELFAQGSINPQTLLVLANAIYFKGLWEEEFEPAGRMPFYLLNGSTVEVEMMRKEGRFGYTAGEGYEAVEVPYKGGELSFVLILPDEGTFQTFEERFTSHVLQSVLEGLRELTLELTMPKFTFSYGFDLKKSLRELGIERAFSGGADFSGMAEGELFIAQAVHKAFIQVDEKGTEAAAATGMTVGRGLIKEVKVDRPFLFLIHDRRTGAILFLGRVLDPRGG